MYTDMNFKDSAYEISDKLCVNDFLCYVDSANVCNWHDWISPQLSQWSWSGQLASVFQSEAGVLGTGPDTDCETETEEGQSPLCNCHPPSEAGTVSSSSQSWKLISSSCHIHVLVCVGPKFQNCLCLFIITNRCAVNYCPDPNVSVIEWMYLCSGS